MTAIAIHAAQKMLADGAITFFSLLSTADDAHVSAVPAWPLHFAPA